ncbi:MAG: efflux RND transporter periplasmic adaptor subunit [Phycisphaerales bacterium]
MTMTARSLHSASRRGIGLRGVAAGVAVLAVVGVGVVMTSSKDDAPAEVASGVELAEASIRSFTITTLSNGELEAKNQLEIRNKVESRSTIIEIVKEGTMAKAGDVLVRLNDEDIRNRIAESELQVIEARTNYESAVTSEKIQQSENESKLRAAESKLSIANLTYEQWEKGDVVKRRQELQLAVEKAQKNLERLTSKYDNSKTLFQREFLSKDELDRDEIAYIEAVSAMKNAELDKEVYETYQYHKDAEQKRRDVEEATAELDRVREENEINLRAKQANTINRQRQLQLREEKLNELNEQLEYCVVVAPRDGLVVYGTSVQTNSWRNQNEGGLAIGREIGNNDLLIALPDTKEMTASVKVHESIAGRVRPGQSVSVKVEAIDRTLKGVVYSVGVLAESGGWRDPNRREYTVKIDLDSDDAQSAGLKPTMRCEARIELGRVDEVVAIPVQAVFNEGAVRYVLRPTANARFERVPVMLGRTSDTDAEIAAGLSAGDRVLLRDPMPGEVINPSLWDQASIESVGYIMGEDGKPTIDYRAMMRNRAARGAGRPAATTKPEGKPESKPEGKPEAKADVEPATTQVADSE